jgi:antitoxin component HigA of HigAB toxin-antitoxin module
MPVLASYDRLLLELKPRPIRTKADYRRVLRQLDDLMEPHPSRERAMMIDLLAVLVEQYEATHFPEPQKLTPGKYLAELIEARELNQAELSRRSGVPRSVLSNILAGRRGVSKAAAIRLSRFFRVPVSIFLDDVE